MQTKIHFDWLDYSVFGFLLLTSSLIGIYFGCIKGGQDTIKGYMFGEKKMATVPIAISLITSYVSSIAMVGTPTEIYTFGSQQIIGNLSGILVIFLIINITLPVFYKLQLTSLYKYFEMRFTRKVRLVMSLLYIIDSLMQTPLIIYGTALALAQVVGLSTQLVCIIMSTVCIFYCSLGGLKAVVWSDTLQAIFMVGSALTVMVVGTYNAGGVRAVVDASIEGERLQFFNMNPDPTIRLSFWSAIIGMTMHWFAQIAVLPSSSQRFISLPTYRQAKISVVILCLGSAVFKILNGMIGLIIFATYKDCDPLRSKVINKPDQIVAYFVIFISENIKGLPGLFIAGVACSGLSTMSTNMNSVSGTIYEDLLEPLLRNKLTEKQASLVMKLLVVIFGIICTLLATHLDKLGTIYEIAVGTKGITLGTMTGILLLGLLFPWANTKGAILGGAVSFVIVSWILIGTHIEKSLGHIKPPFKPFSLKNCTFKVADLPELVNASDIYVFPLYRLSTFYISTLACLIVLIVGLISTWLTGPNDPSTINLDLLSPVIHRFLPKKSHYTTIQMRNRNEFN